MGVTIDHYIQVTENFLPTAQQIGPREREESFSKDSSSLQGKFYCLQYIQRST